MRQPGNRRRTIRSWMLTLSAAVLVAACGARDGASVPSNPTTTVPAPTPASTQLPSSPTVVTSATASASEADMLDPCGALDATTGVEQIVLRVDRRPMQQPPGFVETDGPSAVVYADGHIITHGLEPAIYPGFATPALLHARLTADGLAEVLAAARATGLLDERARTIGAPSSGPYSRYEMVLVDAGVCSSVAIYAPHSATAGSSAETTAAAAIDELTYRSLDLYGAAERGLDLAEPVEGYIPERLRVVAVPAEHARTDPQYHGTERAWPLATPISSFDPFAHPSDAARCAVVSGADLNQLWAALMDRAMIWDPWISDGQRYILYLRPLFPGEPDTTACMDPPGTTAEVCSEGTSVPYPTTMPDPLAEAVRADAIITGQIASIYPVRWTTPDGRRPGACGDDPGEATIVTPILSNRQHQANVPLRGGAAIELQWLTPIE